MARAPARSFWTVVGVFVLFGPPLGGLAMIVRDIWREGDVDPGLAAALVLLSHVGGIFPAAATGLSIAAISSRFDSALLWLLSAVICGAGYSWLILGDAAFMPVGGLAAFGAGLVSLPVRPRWR